MGIRRNNRESGLRCLLAALLALALAWLPALPPSTPPALAMTATMADCAGHAAATPDHPQAPAPDHAHPACCILGQCPMLAAVLPPQPRALPGPALALAPEATAGKDPAGVLRSPPRPPPRVLG